MTESKQESCRPHLLMVPLPAQGHIFPMFKLAKLLHHRGFHITFLNNDFNHRRLLRSQGVIGLEGLIPNFDFASIPDNLPTSDENATQNIYSIMGAISSFSDPFKNIVSRLLTSSSSSDAPPLTCIVADAFMSFAFDVAQQFSIPTVQFVIIGAGPVSPWYLTHDLIENGLIPLKDKNGFLDTVVDCLPGLEDLPLKYISELLLVKDLGDEEFDYIRNMCEKSVRGGSSAILFNTFEDFESASINQLSTLFSSTPVFGIGPIHLLEDKIIDSGSTYTFGANLWKEDTTCFEWLDSKPPNSVLYVSFGSCANLTTQQMIELAWGLANSKKYFLWVIRPDLVQGDGESRILPPEFDAEIKDRGFITSWCPQEKVLKHPSIGGFLTQCGWNSLLECLCAGLPLICLPVFFEQVTSAWLCCNKWGIGLELESCFNINNIMRDEVEKVIKELFRGPKSRELKKNAIEWKKKAEEACETGSSVANFEKLVNLLGSFHASNV